MKITIPYLMILTVGCYVLACSPPKNIEQTTPPSGDYQYAGYDQKGGKIVEGRLSITSVESKRIKTTETIQIKGNWQLKKVGNQENIGPQAGSGELIGSINEDEIYVDLNPNISDSNVILRGKIEGRRFHGTWSFNGFAGPINRGTFEATRK